MKVFSRITQFTAALVLLTGVVFTAGSAFASTPGQISGGNANYEIANLTEGSAFSNTQSAKACDVVEYRLDLYNPGPDAVNNVKVEANINNMTPYTSYVSNATVYTPDGLTQQVNFNATLNMSPAETQTYVADSTVLLDNAGNVIASSANGTLADTITDDAGGIAIGSVGESVQEYLEFKAQLNCPTPTPAVCNSISTPVVDNKTVTIDEVNYTANDATVTGIKLDFGNGYTNVYQPTQSPLAVYTYPMAGSYTITATIQTNLGDVTNAAACSAKITPSTPPTNVVTVSQVTPPAQLINTGPGNTVGLFAGVTVLGAIVHRIYKHRKTATNHTL